MVAMMATMDSAIMAPYPTMRASTSRRINLGVVPLEISAWNPLMAPQAMVMKAKGNIFPAKMGPVPSTKRVSGGMCSVGRKATIPPASRVMVPSLTKVLR